MSYFPGVYVATTTPFRQDGSVDLDAYREHCRWLVDAGIAGLVPNGSLGEYESLTLEERRAMVEATIEAADGRAKVVPGVSAPSSTQARALAEEARSMGADGVMALPPLIHPATRQEIVAHYADIAGAGLPIIAYNNPFSTKKDIQPDLFAELAEIDEVVAVKEFSGDVRRVTAILEAAPRLEVMCGADDVAFESAIMGASGWIGGFTGALPEATIRIFELGQQHRMDEGLKLYRALLPLLRWDTGPQFVQAIKLTQSLVGQPGGPTRPPRLPLSEADQQLVKEQLQHALDAIG